MHAYTFACVYVCAYTCVHVPAQVRGQRWLCSPPVLHIIIESGCLCTRNSKAQKDWLAVPCRHPPISASTASDVTGAWCHAHFLYVGRGLQVVSWSHSERFGAVSSASISCFETRSFCVACGGIEMGAQVVSKLKVVQCSFPVLYFLIGRAKSLDVLFSFGICRLILGLNSCS